MKKITIKELANELNITILMEKNGQLKKHLIGKNILMATFRYIGVFLENQLHNHPHNEFIEKGYFTVEVVSKNNRNGYKAFLTALGMEWVKSLKDRIIQSEIEYLLERNYNVLGNI